MTTNREVLDLSEKCGQPFGHSLFDLVCGRPKGHRPVKKHAAEPTPGDIARTLRSPFKQRRHARSATEFCDVCGEKFPCATALTQRACSDAIDDDPLVPLGPSALDDQERRA